jgi:biotin operon repressor
MRIIKCCICEKEKLSNNEIALSKKLISLKTDRFYCIICLADYLEVTVEELQDKIEEFKAEGCTIFN